MLLELPPSLPLSQPPPAAVAAASQPPPLENSSVRTLPRIVDGLSGTQVLRSWISRNLSTIRRFAVGAALQLWLLGARLLLVVLLLLLSVLRCHSALRRRRRGIWRATRTKVTQAKD